MDSPTIMSSPTKPLNPLSPERMNQQTMPPSPSPASEHLMQRKSRGLSDVQSKVAFLNNLSRGNSPAPTSPTPAAAPAQQPTTSTAALQRAILGREEAESALQKVSEQLSEAQAREQRITERLESLLEQLQSGKERHANERSVFEKEIRKARKEAFRAGSAVVKIQEDLKQARAEARVFKDEVQAEREAKEQAKQEAFERAYALASVTDELEVLKEHLRTLEASNHAHALEVRAQRMQKQDAARLSLAEGDLALLVSPTPRRSKRSLDDTNNFPFMNDSSTQCTPPKRPRLSDVTPKQQTQDTTKGNLQESMLDELQELLDEEKQRRMDAETMIQFMEMECRFKRCSCRLSEEPETPCAHGSEVVAEKHADEPIQHAYDHAMPDTTKHAFTSMLGSQRKSQPVMGTEAQIKIEAPDETMLTFSPETGTFRSVPSPKRPQDKPFIPSSVPEVQSEEIADSSPVAHVSTQQQPPLHETPFERFQPHATHSHHFTTPSPSTAARQMSGDPREQSAEYEVDTSGHPVTRRVLLRTEESRSSNMSQSAVVPGTPVSREDALAQIRARRGRANSMKRSISAGESIMRSSNVGAAPPATGSSNRIPGVQDTGNRRDLSAPVKYHR